MGNAERSSDWPNKLHQYIRVKYVRMLNSGIGSHFDVPAGKAGSTRPPASVGPSRLKTEPHAAPEADTTAPARNRGRWWMTLTFYSNPWCGTPTCSDLSVSCQLIAHLHMFCSPCRSRQCMFYCMTDYEFQKRHCICDQDVLDLWDEPISVKALCMVWGLCWCYA